MAGRVVKREQRGDEREELDDRASKHATMPRWQPRPSSLGNYGDCIISLYGDKKVAGWLALQLELGPNKVAWVDVVGP